MEGTRNEIHREFENDSQLILGLDAGKARCGLARADPSLTLASPLAVIPTHPLAGLSHRIAESAGGGQIALIAAGLPLDQHGDENEMCEFVRSLASQVCGELGCDLEYIDERFTTAYAERVRGHSARGKRPPLDIDAWAAAAILQAYLDSHRH